MNKQPSVLTVKDVHYLNELGNRANRTDALTICVNSQWFHDFAVLVALTLDEATKLKQRIAKASVTQLLELQAECAKDAPEPKNQCDGCCAGYPKDEQGMHRIPEKQGTWHETHMFCTANKYKVDSVDGGARPDTDAVSILHKRYVGNDPLRLAQLEAERALTFLEDIGFQNLDIYPASGEKKTLTELLSAYKSRYSGATDGGARELEQAAQALLNCFDRLDNYYRIDGLPTFTKNTSLRGLDEKLEALRLAMERKAGR
jgi:hypothetical protein